MPTATVHAHQFTRCAQVPASVGRRRRATGAILPRDGSHGGIAMAPAEWEQNRIYVDAMRLRQVKTRIEESVAGLATGAGRLLGDRPDDGPAGLALQRTGAAWVGYLTALQDEVAAIGAALGLAADGYADAEADAQALWSRP